MSDANARLNVLIALKSAVEGGQQGIEWITKYGSAIATTAATMAVFAGKQGIALGSTITDLSTRAQMGSDAFQVLSLTAADSGVSMEEVSKSAAKLRQNIQSAREGNVGLVDSLAKLNLTAAGLQALAPERQWEVIAQRIENSKDRQEALNAAIALFGEKNAPKLMETLQRLGVEGYDKLAAGTAKIRLSPEQLATLDDAGDKLGRIVEHLKYIAAHQTVKVLNSSAVSGTAALIEQTFNDNQIERAKALIKIWRDQGNESMAKNWEDNLARLQAQAVADPYAERNAQRSQQHEQAAGAAREQAMAAGDAVAKEKENLDLEILLAAARKKDLDTQIQQGNALFMENEERKKKLALAIAEQDLSRQLAAGQAAIARIQSDPHLLNTTKMAEENKIYAQNNQQIAERIQLLEQQQEVNPDPTRQGQIDSLRAQQAANSLAMENNTPKSAGYGAMSGMVEYINSIPAAAARAQSAVMSIASAMEDGISTSLTGLIKQTMTWGEALQNIGTSVIDAIIQAFVRMAAQWIVQQIVMAVFGNAIRAAQMAAMLPVTAAMTAMWMPAATAASIASWGGAAVTGAAAAHTAVYAAAAGFAKGGPVAGGGTGTSDSIPAWLSNGEYVMPAAETAKYRPLLDAMRAGTLASSPMGAGGGAPMVNVGGANISIGMIPHGMSPEQWARSQAGEAYLLNFMQRNIHKVSARA